MEKDGTVNHMKKLSLALAALAISGTLAGPANALTSKEVTQIRAFVEAGDDAGLRAYLLANLGLLDNSPLSALLRAYISKPPETAIFVSLGFQSEMPEDLLAMLDRAKRDSSLY